MMFRFSSSKSQEEIPAPSLPSTDQDQAPPSLVDETVVDASSKDNGVTAATITKKQKRDVSTDDEDIVILESLATSKKEAPKASTWEPPSPRERKVAAEKQLLKVVDGLTSKYAKKNSAVAVSTIKNDDDESIENEEQNKSNKKRKIDDDGREDDAFSLHTVESEDVYVDIDKIPSVDESTKKIQTSFVETIQSQGIEDSIEQNKASSSELSMHASDVDDDIDLDSTTPNSVSFPTGSDEEGSNNDPKQIRLRARSILSQASQSPPPSKKKVDNDDTIDHAPDMLNQDHSTDNMLTSESHHTTDVLLDVGNLLLNDDRAEHPEETKGSVHTSATVETKKRQSHFWCKLLVLVILSLLGAVNLMPRSQDISSVLRPASEIVDIVEVEQNSTLTPTDAPSSTDSSSSASFPIQELLDEDMPLPITGDKHPSETEHDDNAIPEKSSSIGDTLKMAGMVFLFLLALSKPSTPDEDDDESNDDDDETVNQVKTEGFVSYNLSNYEDLKVVELRDLLRQRGCKTIGRKHILICRLASVYKAELDTMTVKQLRRILKSKGFKQGGLKSEIIQKLVEAGCM